MAEQVWKRPHRDGPTAIMIVASDQDRTNGHSHDPLFLLLSSSHNAQVRVIINNLQNLHEKSLPPTGVRGRMLRMELEYQDWARLQGGGPRTGGPKDRLVGWRMW